MFKLWQDQYALHAAGFASTCRTVVRITSLLPYKSSWSVRPTQEVARIGHSWPKTFALSVGWGILTSPWQQFVCTDARKWFPFVVCVWQASYTLWNAVLSTAVRGVLVKRVSRQLLSTPFRTSQCGYSTNVLVVVFQVLVQALCLGGCFAFRLLLSLF